MKKAEPGTPPDDEAASAASATSLIDAKIVFLADWREKTLAIDRVLNHRL